MHVNDFIIALVSAETERKISKDVFERPLR